MEISNLPVISKRVWSIVRVLFFMRPKGFTKPKLLMHLNLMLKLPGKLAGKAVANLISHHHHSHHGISAASHDAPLQFCTAREYEFSCGNAPKYNFFSKRHTIPRHFPACAHAPLTLDDGAVEVNNALKLVSEMLKYDKKGKAVMEASPAVPASGRTRMVRQVRVTDSPFPVQYCDDDGDHQVDKAAEEFINSFYMELMKQG
ncbi:hypothetical protein K1719_021173 [Acacia pycnantha]|nr:hypothetical protein K1719_021173 [Acacia pycnantha]